MVAIKGIIIDDGPTLEKGGYIFYSGFKYGSSKTVNSSNNFVSTKRIKVNQFFFVRISRHDDPCIGELVSLWKDKYSDTMLASVRLYFLPEQTPDGRQSYHGQHEVLAASEPVILRLNDLVSWITEEVDWVTGLEVPYHASHIDPPAFTLPFLNLINKKIPTGCVNNINPHQSNDCYQIIVVLSYPQYCRYRAVHKKMEENIETLSNCHPNSNNITNCNYNDTKASTSPPSSATAAAPFDESNEKKETLSVSPRFRVLFCRETFEHEGLLHHDLNCEHLAPKLKGRPRKRGSNHHHTSSANNKATSSATAMSLKLAEKCLKNESEFMKQLNKFMKERNTPITRIPHLGFKKIDLFYLFTFTQKLGGYEKITQNKEWKKVYDELGGDPRSTSAATCTRRHFERLLLPFENHLAEARGLVVTRRSKRGRSISPILPAGSPVTRGSSSAAAGFDDDYQSIGSVNSTERRSHRRSHRRQGVRQSKRLKGVNSSSGGGVSASSTVGGSNASSTATDDDECYSPMSNEDDNNNNNKEEETGDEITSKSVELKGRSSRSSAKGRSRKLSGGEEETHSVSSSSSKSREDDNGALNKSKDNQSDSLTEEDEDNDHQEEEEGEGVDTGDGVSRRKRKRRKGGKSCKVVKCKSRSPSVENNLNSSNVKKSQSERKFVVKIDGLSTGDPKIRNEGEIMSEGGEMASSQRSATSPVNLLVPKSEPIETTIPTKTATTQDNSDSITKEKHISDNEFLSSSLIKPKTENESEDDSMITAGTVNAYLKMLNKSLIESDTDQCIPVSGSKLPVKSEVKPFNTKESVNYDDNETGNNNDNTNNIEGDDLKLPESKTTPCNKNNNNNDKINGTNLSTGTNHCDNVNSSLSKSDTTAKITANPTEITDIHGSGTNTGGNNIIIDSPLSSISTLISAMDAAKQKQIKLDSTATATATNNDNHQLSSASPTVGQTNINIVQSNVTLTCGSFGSVKKSHHVKNNANATIFQNINSRSGSSASLSPSSGRPSVIQKTPLKPCVKVVPTYKDNPIDGLLKDNSLLKKTQLPPIAHAASFLSSSPTWFSSSSSGTPPGVPTLVNSKNNNRNSSSSSSSLKRKLGPSVNENSPDTFPLDLTNKKRPCDLDSQQIKSLTSKEKIPALIKLVNEGDDGTFPPAAILDLSSKIRIKESLSSKTCSSGSNTKIDNNNNNNSLQRPLSFHHQQHQDANSDVNLVQVPKVPKSNISDRMKSNSSKSGNNHQQPPSSRQLVNQSPLSISSPVPSGLVGILPPSSTPSSTSSSSSSTPAAVVVAPTPKYHSSTSTSTNKHHQQQAPQQNVSNSNRSQLVKPSPSPNALKERKESKVNHLSPVIHPGFAIKDLNQQQQQLLIQTHLNDVVNGISNQQQQHHSHHQRRQQYQSQQPSSSHHHQQQQQQQQQQPQPQQQQLPLQLPAIPFPDNRDTQSKLQSANTLNQLRAMVTPDFALAQQTIAQEIALREMERLNPNFAKQMSQMSSAAAAAAMLGYPTGFHPMLNMPTHRSTVPTSSPSISDYNPTLPSFLPFFNSFIPPGSAAGPPGVPTHSTGNGSGGVSTPNSNGNMAANAANNVNSAVAAAAAAALASGHFFNPAALAAASQGTPFSPLELLGAGLVPGNERFAAAAAADDAARWRGWFESRTFE